MVLDEVQRLPDLFPVLRSVIDSGVVHALLQISDCDALLGHPVAGAGWEYVVEQVLQAAVPPAELAARVAGGAECREP